MKLSELLDSIEVIEIKNHIEVDINKIAYNSKDVEKNDLFVCIKGFKVDGHSFIGNAIENGAAALIVEEIQDSVKLPQYKVQNSRKALSALACRYFQNPSKDFKVIGVTATNGKTTTTFMINEILSCQGYNTGLIGTVLVKYADFNEAAYLTTPESYDLQKIFYNMKKAGVTHACMEVSSSAIDLKRTSDVDFDIVSLNNISRDHIDLHGSFEEYRDTKTSLIRDAKPNQYAILNLDDQYSAALTDKTLAKVITFGIENKTGDIYCRDIALVNGRAKFTVAFNNPVAVDEKIYKDPFELELGTSGYHTIYNAMVAVIASILCGASIDNIQQGLKLFTGVERRFEIIYEDDFIIIDDHFANSGNISATFKTLHKMDYENVRIVYAVRGNRGLAVIREAAETTVEWAKRIGIDEIILSLSKSHVTWKDEVTKEELDTFKNIMEEANINVSVHDELADAIEEGLQKIQKNDILLLAGCQGMDYGAQIVLTKIEERNPNIDKEWLFRPLEKRVAGV